MMQSIVDYSMLLDDITDCIDLKSKDKESDLMRWLDPLLLDDIPVYVDSKNMDKDRDPTRPLDSEEMNIPLETRHPPNVISPIATDCPLGRGRAISKDEECDLMRWLDPLLQDDIPEFVDSKNIDKERDPMRPSQEMIIQQETRHSRNVISPIATDCPLGRGRAISKDEECDIMRWLDPLLQDDIPEFVDFKNMDKERDPMRQLDSQEMIIQLETRQSRNVISPIATDCLLGRGRAIEQHPGNRMFRRVIEQFRTVYSDRERRSDAQVVIGWVLDFLRHRMRFLCRSKKENEWQLATQEKVRRKVGQYLRYLERKES